MSVAHFRNSFMDLLRGVLAMNEQQEKEFIEQAFQTLKKRGWLPEPLLPGLPELLTKVVIFRGHLFEGEDVVEGIRCKQLSALAEAQIELAQSFRESLTEGKMAVFADPDKGLVGCRYNSEQIYIKAHSVCRWKVI